MLGSGAATAADKGKGNTGSGPQDKKKFLFCSNVRRARLSAVQSPLKLSMLR
jgi:hypothetical protein